MLVRFNPYREMLTVRRALDRLAENGFDQAEYPQPEWALALDVVERENEYVVKASLPGVKQENVEITFDKGTLTVRGEIKAESENENERVHLRERRSGAFVRSITLPNQIKADDIQANYQDGVLTLHLPKAEEAKPRKIAVNVGSQN